jgi:hypothetical protein
LVASSPKNRYYLETLHEAQASFNALPLDTAQTTVH